ncbi:MAG: hypothetical protein GW778_04250 [Alphaproteobacteria bacterium]|nr:hypothetical protein [Alphaproteobacteria bacterium]
MAMQALRDGASKGILKFFLLGLLCLAGGGLVFTDVGGFFNGGVSSTDVAKVGKEKIGLNSFDRVARRSLQQLGITPAQAYQLGYLEQVLRAEIQRRTLMKAAGDADIHVGKDYVVKQIHQILAPAMASGMSAEQALENLTRGQSITETELTNTILSERTLTLFGDAMEAGALYTPKPMAEMLYAYDNETRAIRYIAFPDKEFKDIEDPSDEQLMEMYESTKESYAIPERRTLNVVTINTDSLADTLTIEESELQETYDNYIDIYTSPASRTISQAIFKSEDAAKKAAGEISEDNFKQTAYAAKADIIPTKTFSEKDILDELEAPVFTAESTGVIGPIETPLGWSLIHLTKISEETVKPFNEVKAQIRDDIIQERLIDEIYKLVDEVDEFFAMGGSVEDAKSQFNISVKTFEDLSRTGLDTKNESVLNPVYGPDAQTIIQSAYELDEGMSGPAFEINGAKFVVVNTASITPKTYQPFEEVKDAIKTKWIEDQRSMSNRMAAIDLQKQNADAPISDIAKSEGKSFKTLDGILRNDEESPLSATARNSIFEAKEGEHTLIDIKDGVAIAEVTKITEPTSPKEDDLKAVQASTQQAMQNELFILFINKMQETYPARVHDRLLKQIYGQQTESF